MGTHGETLLHPCTTTAAVLRGIRRWDRDDSMASVHCFAFEDGAELGPARVLDTLVETSFLASSIVQMAPVSIRFRCRPAAQIADTQIFQIDDIVLAHQVKRRLMVKVRPLVFYLLVLLGQYLSSLLATFAAFLSAGYAVLRPLQLPLGFAIVPGILHHLAISGDQEHLESDINSGFLTGERQRLR